MRLAVFGAGYVGLVTAACLADVGNTVHCVDVDANKIARLRNGEVPIYEPGLSPIVQRNLQAGRLRFHDDPAEALSGAQIVFIAVGTPPDEDGSADLRYVLAVAQSIGEHVQGSAVVVDKSTVPVGTAERVSDTIQAALAARGMERVDVPVVSNPEFLKEGAAVEDFMRPDRIVIGSDSPAAIGLMRRLYAPFNRNHDRIVVMQPRAAELTKYAANAMLATKISFMNEIATIAEQVGADVEQVRRGIGSDPRIGWHFIYPGAGYGGSCFPKDVQALARTAQAHGVVPELLHAVEAVNERQKGHVFTLMQRHYGGTEALRGKVVALWGLAFKPETDDMREASSRRLLQQLWDAGATVRAYDPKAMDEARRLYAERDDLVLVDRDMDALTGADALVVMTEWKQFRAVDVTRIAQALRDGVLFDGRNLYDPGQVEAAGLAYYGIGRGRSLASP